MQNLSYLSTTLTSQSNWQHNSSIESTELSQEYGRPITTGSVSILDKSSIVWKDFQNGIGKRKGLISRLRMAAMETTNSSKMLKRILLDVRQTTLKLIEDALDIQYRSQLNESQLKVPKGKKMALLPPISSYRYLKEREDLHRLNEMIHDLDEILQIANIKVILPFDFPESRNPFMLGKNVDELAVLIPPNPEAGNLEEELKSLELLRYKRAAKALLRAEAEVRNKLPITLPNLERLLRKMDDDLNVEKLIRCIGTILDNENGDIMMDPILDCITSSSFNVEVHEFLNRLNSYRGVTQLRIDVRSVIRDVIKDCHIIYLEDVPANFLKDWVNLVLGSNNFEMETHHRMSRGSRKGDRELPGIDESSTFHTHAQYGMKGTNKYHPSGTDGLDTQNTSISQDFNKYQDRDVKVVHRQLEHQTPMIKQHALNNYQLASIPASLKQSLHPKVSKAEQKSKRKIQSSTGLMISPSSDSTHPEAHLKLNSTSMTSEVKNGSVSNQRSSVFIKKNIRSEVENVLKDLGLWKSSSVLDENDDEKLDPNRDSKSLNALRYEFFKMQQELLRRQVLDSKFYKVSSMDITSHQLQGLTVLPSVNDVGRSGMSNLPTDSNKQVGRNSHELLVPLVDDEISHEIYKRINILITLDLISENLLCQICRLQDEESDMGASIGITKSTVKTPLCQTSVSKLLFNRVTGYLFTMLRDIQDDEHKTKLLHHIRHPLLLRAKLYPIPKGSFIFPADRKLLDKIVTGDGVLVNVQIFRNNECNGLLLICTPVSGLITGDLPNGPVSMSIHDKELQVLLTNQYGLYTLAKTKWSSMELVAQWLVSRIRVRRIRTHDVQTDDIANVDGAEGEYNDEEETARRSITSELTFHTNGNMIVSARQGISSSRPNSAKFQNPLVTLSDDILDKVKEMTAQNTRKNSKPMVPDILLGHMEMNKIKEKSQKPLMMLDVSLDRSVEISSSLQNQWKQHYLPNIDGISAVIEAVQDLEILKIFIKIQISRRKVNEFDEMEDENDEEEEENGGGRKKGTEIILTYQLTVAELLVFGSTDLVDQKKIRLPNTLRKNKDIEMASDETDHPESYLWNVLSRLQVHFKGSKSFPFKASCSAEDSMNWELKYQRKILREVKTISNVVMIVHVSVTGGDLLFEPELVDPSTSTFGFKKVESKLFNELELAEMVNAEGWPLSKLDYIHRKGLASSLLNKLKIVQDGPPTSVKARLEFYTFPETQLLKIVVLPAPNDAEIEVGSVDINSHYTLSDLRILIREEIDSFDVPANFRFYYKSSACSVRQEPFRMAWELLPKCQLMPKIIPENQQLVTGSPLAQGAAVSKSNAEDKTKVDNSSMKLRKGQRRVTAKLVPMPIYTLCQVTEQANEVHLLHDSRNLGLQIGDVIRIGSILGRDYIISPMSIVMQTKYPKTIKIEPAFDMLGETDFDTPISSNHPWPLKRAGFVQGSKKSVLRTPKELGYKFEIPDMQQFDLETNQPDNKEELDAMSQRSQTKSQVSQPNVKTASKKKQKTIVRTYSECWIWKCVPVNTDRRLKWRQQYDDGLVQYAYVYTFSEEFFLHFRVKAKCNHIEVLCTDVRCAQLSLHHQRVNEMSSIPLDFYTQLAFDNMTQWSPQYAKGVDRTKFIKLMRDVQAFPDIKRPARLAQLDMMFQKELKGEHSIVQKYLNYAGFCKLLQDVAIIRFPYSNRGDGDGDNAVGADDDDEISVASQGSVTGLSVSSTTNNGNPKSNRANKRKGGQDANNIQHSAAEQAHFMSSYQKFVLNTIMTFGTWYESAWSLAKFEAMKKEAVRYCAATRIGSIMRGVRIKMRYQLILLRFSKFQAIVRRKVTQIKIQKLYTQLNEDWCFRMRYNYITMIQSLVRRYLKRRWYYKVLEKIKKDQVAVYRARRLKMKKMKLHNKKSVMYKEATRVNGVIVYIKVLRKDMRSYSRDYGIIIEVYTPHNQLSYRFPVEEPELRLYMEKVLEVKGLSVGDLLDRRNIEKVVAAHLIVIKPGKKTTGSVIFSRHGVGERGERSLTKGKRIAGELFVCKLYETGDEITVHCYHRISCKIFKLKMTVGDLKKWIIEDYLLKTTDEIKRQEIPPLLRPENKNKLYDWILDNIAVDTRKGQFKVLFYNLLQRNKKKELLVKIQAVWRRALVRPKIIQLLDDILIKVHVSPTDHNCYYLNKLNGTSTWEKSKLLGTYDLPTEPDKKWVEIFYQYNGETYRHFVNPYSGLYTHLTPTEGALKIQMLVRKFLLKPIMMPLEQFAKAVTLIKTAEIKYKMVANGGKKKLASIINYALVLHAVRAEELEAKLVYGEAVEMSEANPLVMRAYALYMIGTCEPPINLNRDRSHVLLADALRRDEHCTSFDGAYQLFRYACIAHPHDYRCLLNLALVQCTLYAQNYNAEKLLRRALAIAPFEERVISIWKYLKDRFPDRQLAYNPQSRVVRVNPKKAGKQRVVHGRPVMEDEQWAGWCYVDHDEFRVSKEFKDIPYWYNPADGTEQLEQPDFKYQWEIRKNRSQFLESKFGLEQYYDELTATHFQYHPLTDTYQ